MDWLGWFGSILLSFCGVPEAYRAVRVGYCGLTWLFLVMWLGGEIFVLLPVIFQFPKPWLILNYSTNIICVSILMGYKIYGKKTETKIGFTN